MEASTYRVDPTNIPSMLRTVAQDMEEGRDPYTSVVLVGWLDGNVKVNAFGCFEGLTTKDEMPPPQVVSEVAGVLWSALEHLGVPIPYDDLEGES